MELAELNDNYQEILRLDELLETSEFPHTLRRRHDGWQILCYDDHGETICSVLECTWSLGSQQDQLEMLGFSRDPDDPNGVTANLSAWQVYEHIYQYHRDAAGSRRIRMTWWFPLVINLIACGINLQGAVMTTLSWFEMPTPLACAGLAVQLLGVMLTAGLARLAYTKIKKYSGGKK